MSLITTFVDINSLVNLREDGYIIANQPLIDALKRNTETLNIKFLSNHRIQLISEPSENGQKSTKIYLYRKISETKEQEYTFTLPFKVTNDNFLIVNKMDSAHVNPVIEQQIHAKNLNSDQLMLLTGEQSVLDNCPKLISNKLKTYWQCELNVDHLNDLKKLIDTLPTDSRIVFLIDIDGTLFNEDKTILIGKTVINEQILELIKNISEKYKDISYCVLTARAHPFKEILQHYEEVKHLIKGFDPNEYIKDQIDFEKVRVDIKFAWADFENNKNSLTIDNQKKVTEFFEETCVAFKQSNHTICILDKFQKLAKIKLDMNNSIFIDGPANKIPFLNKFEKNNPATLYIYLEDREEYVTEVNVPWENEEKCTILPNAIAVRAMCEDDIIETFEARIDAAIERLYDAQRAALNLVAQPSTAQVLGKQLSKDLKKEEESIFNDNADNANKFSQTVNL